MSYEINPVNATINKCQKNGCGVNCLSNTCYNICAAFNGAQSVYDIDPQCAKMCQNLVDSKKDQMYGDEYRMSRRFPQKPPVMMDNTPKYFPSLFEKHKNKEVAKKLCYQMCDGDNNELECKEWCDVLSNAVQDNSYNLAFTKEQTNNVIFWLIYIIAGFVLLWVIFKTVSFVVVGK